MFDENSKHAGWFATLRNDEFNRHPTTPKRPLAPATEHRKALKIRPYQAKIIVHSSAQAKPHLTHNSHPFQTTLYIIYVKSLNN